MVLLLPSTPPSPPHLPFLLRDSAYYPLREFNIYWILRCDLEIRCKKSDSSTKSDQHDLISHSIKSMSIWDRLSSSFSLAVYVLGMIVSVSHNIQIPLFFVQNQNQTQAITQSNLTLTTFCSILFSVRSNLVSFLFSWTCDI